MFKKHFVLSFGMMLLLGGVISTAAQDETTPITLQLQWVAQSQFAGYYAALDMGFYQEAGLDVTIQEGGVGIRPQQVVASGDAEFGVTPVLYSIIESNNPSIDLVNIAQIFQRSGTVELAFADSGIETIADFADHTIGTWGFGNEYEVYTALRQAGIDPDNPADVTIIRQTFDMSQLLNREVDAAQAMIFNEYGQVLATENPETGELYRPEDFNVIDFNAVGTAILQDHIYASADWLAEEGNEDIAVRFIAASMQGWIYCRENFDECVNSVLDHGENLGASHQRWQLNEINALIWPSPDGIGIMDPALWDQTMTVLLENRAIDEASSEDAYRTDLAQQAIDLLKDLNPDIDVTGEDWERIKVELNPGGV